jgi:hypothetical protein
MREASQIGMPGRIPPCGYTGSANFGHRGAVESIPDDSTSATDPAMNDSSGYAVFFYPPAIEALGDAIKPYLQEGPMGPHIPCREVDTSGAFIEMTIEGRTAQGEKVALDLMVPGSMVRMIVSAHSDNEFGFYARGKPSVLEPGMTTTAAMQEPAPAANAPEDAPKT